MSLKKNPYQIQPEERVQIARETNRIHLPRELRKWIQSLDLSYKIKQINRDLANGFCIAEILSRYPVPYVTNLPYNVDTYYRVNMQEFSSGSSYEERITNWRHICKILKKYYQMPIAEDIPGKIINFAPNAAFDFLCVLYKFLTKRDANILNKVDETEKFKNYQEVEVLPKYMRPTASLLVKDKEVQRIQDDLIRKRKLNDILAQHNGYLANERENFIKEKQYLKEKEMLDKNFNSKTQLNAKRRNSGNQQENKNNAISNNMQNESNEENEDGGMEGSDRKKEDKVNLMGLLSDVPTMMKENENVEGEFRTLIRKNFVDADKNLEMDLKSYTEEKDIIDYFFEKISLCTEEHLTNILQGYEDKEKDIIGIISRTLVELFPFIKLVCRFFDAFYKYQLPWTQFKTSTLKICNSVRDITGEQCDNIFLNFCIDPLLDMIKVNPHYRNEMCQIIFSLTTNSLESNVGILRKISKKFSNSDELLFYHILVQCMNNVKVTEEGINDDFYIFYNTAIRKGLTSSCDLIKIKSIYLINQFINYSILDCLDFHENVFKHLDSSNWEILSLILIYCSKTLGLYNKMKIEKEHMLSGQQGGEEMNINENENENENRKDNEGDMQLAEGEEEGKEDMNSNVLVQEEEKKSEEQEQGENVKKEEKEEVKEEVKDEEGEEEAKEEEEAEGEAEQEVIENAKEAEEVNEEEKKENENNNQEEDPEKFIQQPQDESNPQEAESHQEIPQEMIQIDEMQKETNFEEYNKKMFEEMASIEGKFLKIIDHIFDLPSPNMTVKIGFIYLAEILVFYPDLAKKYIKLLIEYGDNTIRKDVLKVNNSEEEEEYTINAYTERYKFCGAPYFWNQLVVAGIFRDYVIENKLENFNSSHLLIFHSIIINQPFGEKDSEQWIELYNDLKRYLFIALCENQFSKIAMVICNKIFSFDKILGEVLESTFGLFISTMKIIYKNDVIDEPQENMRELLTFISELQSEKCDCKGYVYKLIKTFAIQNDKLYLKSNLLDLMNSIYNERRGNIFSD